MNSLAPILITVHTTEDIVTVDGMVVAANKFAFVADVMEAVEVVPILVYVIPLIVVDILYILLKK